MRSLGLAALAALAVLGALAPPAAAATERYPDLATLPPRDLRFAGMVDVNQDGNGTANHNVLRFSNTVYNRGPGPLELWGTIDSSTKRGDATQRVYNSDGTTTDYPTGSQFYYHPSHNHYHFDNWGEYQLWKASDWDAWVAGGRVGPPKTLFPGTKTSSCAVDEELVQSSPGTPAPGVYGIGGCMPDPVTGVLFEGISVGWGDTYDYYRGDQWIDLGVAVNGQPFLPDGDYVLRSITDPKNLIYESPGRSDVGRESQQDNEGVTRFRVTGGQLVDLNPPSGTVTVDWVDRQTGSPKVTVQAFGRDDMNPIDKVRLSNDGTTWTGDMTYAGHPSTAPSDPSYPMSIPWDLRDYGGSGAAGTHTVYVKFHDQGGQWSDPVSNTIDLAPRPTLYSTTVLADQPAGFWRLGEPSGTRVFDYAGGNRGDYQGSPGLGQAGLVPGDAFSTAVHFDGLDDMGAIPDDPSLDLTNAVAVEAWIKPDALPAIGSFASVASKDRAYSLQFNGHRLELTLFRNTSNPDRIQAPDGA
nr:hypothetical protein [Actinomycetota bacterium]